MNPWFSKSSIQFTILAAAVGVFVALGLTAGSAEAARARGKKALAETYNLPTPKRLTLFKHPVIYASADVYAKRVGSKTVVRQSLIIKWGLHVFEVAEGLYQCAGTVQTGFDCEWVDHTRVATYSSCDVSGVPRGEKPKCVGLISGNSGPTEDIEFDASPDSTSEPGRYVPDEWSEFPERHHDPENPIP